MRPWPTSAATWPSTRSTTGRSACCRWSITAATAAWRSASSTTTRRNKTSTTSWRTSRGSCRRGNGPAQLPKQPRGRPNRERQAQARQVARRKQRVADLFEHRHLFVRHERTPAQRQLLQRLTRGLPQLRTLRALVDEVYRLFDRRCKTATALGRLGKLRRRVRRLKRLGRTLDKLKSANLEKALVFLDDGLLPSTSNAVERGNRRFRKAQKSIYSVRTQQHLEERIALDMQREQRASHQRKTLKTLHQARSGS